jgi:hypothetical protein
MSFWADRSTEPKRSYRWIMSLNGIDSWIIKTTDKPSFTLGVTEHAYLNYDFKFPGRVKWNDVNVTLVDPVVPDAAQTMVEILRASGYAYPNEADQSGQNALTISKKKACDALGNVLIKQLDADGSKGFIEVWQLKNAWVKDVKFGKLDYKSEDTVEISLTLTYDWAVINPNRGDLAPGSGNVSGTFQRPVETG